MENNILKDSNLRNQNKDFVELLKSWYKIYGKSVVLSRAIPHYLDGLKPVQRRIYFVIFRENYTRKMVKSTAICADTQKYFHPHGEAAVYNSLVKLAQDFYTRVSAIETQGNWGSSDGDSAAASRYTECKGGEVLKIYSENLNYDVVPMVVNYAGSDKEPEFLPVRLPMCIINGCHGIAVGYATSIPPFNPKEVFEYCKAKLLDSSTKIEDYILGPDFPEGGELLIDPDKHLSVLNQGRGGYKLRSSYWIEANIKGFDLVHFTNTPYRCTRSSIVKEIDDLCRSKSIPGLTSVIDLSDRKGVDLVVRIKSELLDFALRELFNKTNLQMNVPVNIVCVKNNRPKVLSVEELIDDFLEMRLNVSLKMISQRLQEIKEKIEKLKLNIALYFYSTEIIYIVKNSKEPQKDLTELNFKIQVEEDSLKKIFEPFKMKTEQAIYIMSLSISRIRSSVHKENLKEIENLIKERDKLKVIRDDRKTLKEYVIEDMKEAMSLIKPHLIERKTKIIDLEKEKEFQSKGLIIVYQDNVISKHFLSDLSFQRKGGKGKKLTKTDLKPISIFDFEGDKVQLLTDMGRILNLNTLTVPFSSQEELFYVGSQLNLEEGEKILGSLKNPLIEGIEGEDHIIIMTNFGRIKLISSKDIGSRSKKLIKLSINERLIKASRVNLKNNIILFSSVKAIKFKISDIRISRAGSGPISGIKLREKETSVGFIIEREPEDKFVVIRSGGFGKVESCDNFKLQRRPGIGLNVSWKHNEIVGLGDKVEDFICLLKDGRIIKIDLEKIRLLSSRTAKGVKLIEIGNSQILSSV